MSERSAEINELAAALAKAQGIMEGASKDAANPFFKSKYADLASVWAACREPLASNGLSVVQCPFASGNIVGVESILMHSSGQWLSTILSAEAKDATPQAVGSAITYLKRYQLQSIVGVAPEDDDGEAAQGRGKEAKTTERKGKPAAGQDSTPPAQPTDPEAETVTHEEALEIAELAKGAGYASREALLPVLQDLQPGIERIKGLHRSHFTPLRVILRGQRDAIAAKDVEDVFGSEHGDSQPQ